MGNTFGKIFRLITFGESHGEFMGGIIDGCPPGIKIDINSIQIQLDRRKTGQSQITTQRKESEKDKEKNKNRNKREGAEEKKKKNAAG